MNIDLEEGDRQMILLSLALCALLKPGFNAYITEIAERLQGKEMFWNFKRYNEPVIPTEALKTGVTGA